MVIMKATNFSMCAAAALMAFTLGVPAPGRAAEQANPDQLLFPNATGVARTLHTSGSIDGGNAFFQPLGTNGRSCGTCHQASEGWTVTPAGLKERFLRSKGLDPIFRLNDGANSPNANTSTYRARREAFSMLLDKGLIRVGIGIPDNAEFELVNVDDPYGHASSRELSLFRRPLPATNLGFLSTVMWDGRETFADDTSKECVVGTAKCFASMHFDLLDQANAATLGHAQAATPLTPDQRNEIVSFEMGLTTAQIFDKDAFSLTAQGARGGPEALLSQSFYFGVNDVVFGDYRTGASFTSKVFNLYDAWVSPLPEPGETGRLIEARRAVARGQDLFNTKSITITNVKGLNDDLSVPVLHGTCTTCHDTPNVGHHSIPAPLDIGLTDASRRTPDMPLYTLRNKSTGETTQTTDPGRALITGKWRDIGRFKGPILRAVATRAPYFHNGFAADLEAVVNFYNDRFDIGFTDQERRDLVAFLRTL